jgi:hypothetical protein
LHPTRHHCTFSGWKYCWRRFLPIICHWIKIGPIFTATSNSP